MGGHIALWSAGLCRVIATYLWIWSPTLPNWRLINLLLKKRLIFSLIPFFIGSRRATFLFFCPFSLLLVFDLYFLLPKCLFCFLIEKTKETLADILLELRVSEMRKQIKERKYLGRKNRREKKRAWKLVMNEV